MWILKLSYLIQDKQDISIFIQKLEFDSIFGCKMHSIQNKLNEKKKTEKEYAKFISHVFGWLFMKTGRYK